MPAARSSYLVDGIGRLRGLPGIMGRLYLSSSRHGTHDPASRPEFVLRIVLETKQWRFAENSVLEIMSHSRSRVRFADDGHGTNFSLLP